jgi:flagellar basal-body rod protein FlgF/flagellar basal-body rod protein FlgG
VGVDGVLSAAGGVVATVGVFSFPAGTQLTAEGTNRYVAPDQATVSVSKAATIHEGALETANQGVIPGTLNLILVQREAEMMQKALTIFHTDFNKFATEDLPRV